MGYAVTPKQMGSRQMRLIAISVVAGTLEFCGGLRDGVGFVGRIDSANQLGLGGDLVGRLSANCEKRYHQRQIGSYRNHLVPTL
jgi:hypothetical protein